MEESPMDKVLVEVFGPEPPCARCLTTLRNANQAAAKLKDEGVEVIVNKLDIASREVVSKYGVLLSPALAVDGRVRVAGRIPNPDEIVKIIKGSV